MKTETEIAALPDDTLFDVLRRLPARSLAAARSVCKPWRSMVDDRALLPRPVHGIFINYVDHGRPHLFSRPTSTTRTTPTSRRRRVVDGLLSFMPNDAKRNDWWSVLDHCSGLLLCHVRSEHDLCVCNPATRRWTRLPGNPDGTRYAGAYLAFDPSVSPGYEVILVPILPPETKPETTDEKTYVMATQQSSFYLEEVKSYEEFQQTPSVTNEDASNSDAACGSTMEWPPSPWKMKVFSSRTGRWEDRYFVREGEPAGMIEDMWEDPAEPTYYGPRRRYAVYLQGALYVHCRGHFVARLSLSDGKYQVIKTPAYIQYEKSYLGRSGNGVCFGIVHEGHLRVWILTESCGNMEWVLQYQNDLRCYAKHIRSLHNCKSGKLMKGPWTVEEYRSKSDSNSEALKSAGVEWDSENDDILAPKIEHEKYYRETLDILGFHPYKEVIYLTDTFRVMTYHLNSSRAQYLGNSLPDCYYRNLGIYESFVYTPSLIGDLDEGKTEKKVSNNSIRRRRIKKKCGQRLCSDGSKKSIGFIPAMLLFFAFFSIYLCKLFCWK